jgi:hypothetical protein
MDVSSDFGGMWGGLFFGFFLLAEQKKETRVSGRDPTSK